MSDPAFDALDAAIRDAAAPERLREDPQSFLSELGVSVADSRALLEYGAPRLLVYRRLVHNRLRNATVEFIPRAVARRGKKAFRAEFERFVHERAAHTAYLRDVPVEFVDWVEPRWRADPEVPDYLGDLARHELLDFTVRNDWKGGEEPTGLPLGLDAPLRFDGAARLMRYDHAVHRLPLDPDDRSEPQREPTQLLVYRDDQHGVRYLELTVFAAEVLDRLMNAGDPVADGLRAACSALGHALDDEHLATAAHLLADLADRGVMLGAEPPADSGSYVISPGRGSPTDPRS